MKRIRLVLALALFIGWYYLYSQVVVQSNELEPVTQAGNTMNARQVNLNKDSMGVVVDISRLVCREQLSPPSGVPNQASRDTGFALVLINLENHQESTQVVIIQEVSIRNSSDDRLQSFNFEPMVVHLRPLEHAAVDIHLSNQMGYGNQENMTAFVTYEINGQVRILQSESVAVDRM